MSSASVAALAAHGVPVSVLESDALPTYQSPEYPRSKDVIRNRHCFPLETSRLQFACYHFGFLRHQSSPSAEKSSLTHALPLVRETYPSRINEKPSLVLVKKKNIYVIGLPYIVQTMFVFWTVKSEVVVAKALIIVSISALPGAGLKWTLGWCRLGRVYAPYVRLYCKKHFHNENRAHDSLLLFQISVCLPLVVKVYRFCGRGSHRHLGITVTRHRKPQLTSESFKTYGWFK